MIINIDKYVMMIKLIIKQV